MIWGLGVCVSKSEHDNRPFVCTTWQDSNCADRQCLTDLQSVKSVSNGLEVWSTFGCWRPGMSRMELRYDVRRTSSPSIQRTTDWKSGLYLFIESSVCSQSFASHCFEHTTLPNPIEYSGVPQEIHSPILLVWQARTGVCLMIVLCVRFRWLAV